MTGTATITISGSNFGTVQGSLGFCAAGASPCVAPPWDVTPLSYNFVQWQDNVIEATVTLPPTVAETALSVFVTAVAWITAADAANPSTGEAAVNSALTISGQVTSDGTNNPTPDVTITLKDGNNDVVAIQQTDSNGRYSFIVVPGTYTVAPSKVGLYFDPASELLNNVDDNRTADFTAIPIVTIFLIHGIGQSSTDMADLAGNLLSLSGGLNLSKFTVDDGFDYSECAANSSCSGGCSISGGAQKLAKRIATANPPGKIVLLGFSMGGLIARDLIANNYSQVLAAHPVTGLITLGTPNLGYPFVIFDQDGFCPQLVQAMAGSWNTTTGVPNPLSPYLQQLASEWQSSGYTAYWLAAAGQSCANAKRTLNTSIGCVLGTKNDGVVCGDSALYNPNASHAAIGPAPTVLWHDPEAKYVHSLAYAGYGAGLVVCTNSGSSATNPPLYDPPVLGGLLFSQIVGVINGF